MLFGSKALEIVIGIFFIYMLLSMLASSINEWIAALTALRASTLRKGIANLLDDPIVTDLAKRFYKHPLIEKLGSRKEIEPSYIGARTFSTVLLDLLPIHDETSGVQTSLETFRRLRATLADLNGQGSPLAHVLLRLIERVGVTPAQIETAQALMAQLDATRAALAATSADPAASPTMINLLIERMQAIEIAYKTLEAEVSSSLDQAQKSIETYFDQAMERLSGEYRRYTQVMLTIIALLITVLLNADTFVLISRLSMDDNLRASLTERAITTVVPDSIEEAPLPTSDNVPDQDANDTVPVTVENPLEVLDSLNLLLGWTEEWPQAREWPIKLLGLLVTTIAVSMGAPFWYDLLSYVTNVRLAGRPPKSSVPTAPPAEPN